MDMWHMEIIGLADIKKPHQSEVLKTVLLMILIMNLAIKLDIKR